VGLTDEPPLSQPAVPIQRAEEGAVLLVRGAGGGDVGVHVLLGLVMGGHLMKLAALFV